MTPSKPESPEAKKLIIHHLSDLHYRHDDQGNSNNPLISYALYLQELPEERQPSIVIITGDITENGTINDLETVASNLRVAFPKWAGHLDEHICVVPGPHDICWTSPNRPGFGEFYKAFGDFSHPLLIKPIITGSFYQLYPVNTTYVPGTLPPNLKREHAVYLQRYEQFQTLYRQSRNRFQFWKKKKANDQADKLREAFLQLTETNQLPVLDMGIINKEDLESLRTWASQSPAPDQLRILVTHHPLLINPESKYDLPLDHEIRRLFRDFVVGARAAKFQLALHGYMHKPQVLSDLSLVNGNGDRYPLQQIGAGSIGNNNIFNEIIASYQPQEKIWQMEIQMINVKEPSSTTSISFVLQNPLKDITDRAKQLEEQLECRKQFEKEIRSVMEEYSEAIIRVDRSLPSHSPLPQVALNSIERIIREEIFKDFDVRVALALKEINPKHQHIWELRNTYLAPTLEGQPNTLLYPASLAAWAIILGRALLYPPGENEQLQNDDFLWLRRSGKIIQVQQDLDKLIQDAMGRSSAQDPSSIDRYSRLRELLQEPGTPTIYIRDLYQPQISDHSKFSFFVAIPIPFRSHRDSTSLPEIGALDISVKERNPEPGKEKKRDEIFTSDRLDMLQTLSDLITQILCSSDAVRSPKGSWNEKLR
jgi:hypothetical protein